MPPGKKDRFAEAFIDALEFERNCARGTLINYRHALATFRQQPDLPAWKECAPDHFRRFLFELQKKETARATIRLHFAALRTFYKFLTERHGLRVNPLKEVLLPKAEKKLPLVLTIKQVDELLTAPFKATREKQAPAWAA